MIKTTTTMILGTGSLSPEMSAKNMGGGQQEKPVGLGTQESALGPIISAGPTNHALPNMCFSIFTCISLLPFEFQAITFSSLFLFKLKIIFKGRVSAILVVFSWIIQFSWVFVLVYVIKKIFFFILLLIHLMSI